MKALRKVTIVSSCLSNFTRNLRYAESRHFRRWAIRQDVITAGSKLPGRNICNGKLLLSESLNWQSFADKMEMAVDIDQPVSSLFFNHFYWETIASKAANIIESLE